jgi:murein DD-endopeptidase MepM/ murein hydrolase activator NlpD
MTTSDAQSMPRRLRRLLPVGVLCALVAVVVAPGAAGEDLQSEIDAKQAKLDEVHEEQGVLTTTISRYNDEISTLEGQVATLRTQEAAAEAELARKQAELEQATAELERAKRRLEVLRHRLRRALIVLRERLVAIYESGDPDVITMILSSNGWRDLVERTQYLNAIQDRDNAVVGRVRDLRNQMKRTVARLRAVREQIEAARDEIAARERELASARAAVETRQAELIAVRAEREGALSVLNQHEDHLEADLSELSAEVEAQLARVPSAPLPSGPMVQSSSGLIWPVNGAVVSGFGMRWGRMHEGIDIAVPAGTPIVAAASGTVVLLQSDASSGGYGNFTCVDHGGGLSTCYAHQSSFATSSGASVSQGQVIGYVGCTGHCFGDHLHFEVRVNGVPQDPLGYL